MSMHKLTAGDGYAYLTWHVAAGDACLDARASLTAYYEQNGNPSTAGTARDSPGSATPLGGSGRATSSPKRR